MTWLNRLPSIVFSSLLMAVCLWFGVNAVMESFSGDELTRTGALFSLIFFGGLIYLSVGQIMGAFRLSEFWGKQIR